MRAILLLIVMTGLALAGGVPPERVEHAGVRFEVVRLDPAALGLVWKGADGEPMRTFERVRAASEGRGRKLRLVMNAGIFEPGGVPSGLHVEEGRILHPLNLRDGEGNFFLKPNGVFGVTREGEAKVVDSRRATADGFRLAVQSGPLLLLGGKRHPAFRRESSSTKHRNGIGVDARGRVVLAMTEWGQEVNFWNFAGLFLELGCRDALFLDGDISQLAVDPKPGVRSNRFGAMFVVTAPAE